MKHIFIVNPNAGQKQQDLLIEKIRKVFEEKDFYIEYTTKEKEATEIAKRYAKSGIQMCIYACGGDGTLHEVVNGIIGYKNVSLGIIPIGTGNDFIKSLSKHYKKSDFLNIENYLEAVFEPCDLLKIDQEYSLNTVSIGFDVRIAEGVSKFRKLIKNGNTIPYLLSLLTSIARSLGFELNVLLDGVAGGVKDYSFVVAGNGKYYGGGFLPCPDADFKDGYIDVCLVKKIKHIQIPQLIGKYKKGTHTKYSEIVEMRKVKKMQIIARDMIEICLDGEIRKYLNPIIEIVPSAITLCLPRKEEM